MGSGNLFAGVIADSTGVRGSLDLSSQINKHVALVAQGWLGKEWEETDTSFGAIGGVKIRWCRNKGGADGR